MCEHHVHHSQCAPVAHTGCCCGPATSRPGVPFGRRFPTHEEEIARLEAYLQDLEGQAEAVKDRIAALQAAD